MTDNSTPASAAGRFTLPGTTISVNRMGYGAMQLAGPGIFGEPQDPAECAAVLEEAVSLGIDHIDTSDFYGPYVTNRIIRETLAPYPEQLVLVTKVGAWRDEKGGWNHDLSRDFLRRSLEENLEHLGLDQMAWTMLKRRRSLSGSTLSTRAVARCRSSSGLALPKTFLRRRR